MNVLLEYRRSAGAGCVGCDCSAHCGAQLESMWVLSAGHTECVDVLLEYKSAVDAVTTSGSTALHSAASNGHALVVDRLIKNGADVDVQVSAGISFGDCKGKVTLLFV